MVGTAETAAPDGGTLAQSADHRNQPRSQLLGRNQISTASLCRYAPLLLRVGGGLSVPAQDKLGNRAHRGAVVHRRALDPPERLGLAQPVLGHQRALRPLDELARLEP